MIFRNFKKKLFSLPCLKRIGKSVRFTNEEFIIASPSQGGFLPLGSPKVLQFQPNISKQLYQLFPLKRDTVFGSNFLLCRVKILKSFDFLKKYF